MMDIVGSQSTLKAAVLATVLGFGLSWPSSASDLQAKLEYCKTCHGLSGQGYLGYYPMPRLAGQQPQYIENQLRAFTEGRRKNPVMSNVTRGVTPTMLTALAAHFKDLNPKPAVGGPKKLVAEGKRIFDEGIPESNVPACFACHGAEAKGQNEIPRLAGQLYPYIVGQMTNWSKERGQDAAKPDASAIMGPTSHNLTRSQVEAVAAYVSHLQ